MTRLLTLVVVRKLLILINFQFTSRQRVFESSCDFRRRIDISDKVTCTEYGKYINWQEETFHKLHSGVVNKCIHFSK